MANDGWLGLASGGFCSWWLPGDETGPRVARSLLHRTMAALGVCRDVIQDGELAVSETATNALRHGRLPGDRPPTPPELWVWTRTVPSPQLVVSVFDRARTAYPRPSAAGLLDEHGKGLDLLSEVTADWGSAPTRSRLAEPSTQGKSVWFALPLPADWPGQTMRVHPLTAAQTLLLSIVRRGFSGKRSTDERGLSVLALPGLNVWVHRDHFCWPDGSRDYLRRPLIDLQETAEQVVRRLDGTAPSNPSSTT
jgi:hypothetical protein